jgi:hypothetical protein
MSDMAGGSGSRPGRSVVAVEAAGAAEMQLTSVSCQSYPVDAGVFFLSLVRERSACRAEAARRRKVRVKPCERR